MTPRILHPWEDPAHPGNSPRYLTGKPCIVRGCEEPAGTVWSRLWCQKCNAARINRIGASLADMQRRLDSPMATAAAAWDLGIGDATAIWVVQRVGKEVRLIDIGGQAMTEGRWVWCPPGWRVVPEEPTDDQLRAMTGPALTTVYRTGVAAAPTPPSGWIRGPRGAWNGRDNDPHLLWSPPDRGRPAGQMTVHCGAHASEFWSPIPPPPEDKP